MATRWNPDRVIVLTSDSATIEKHIRLRNRPHENVENMVRRFRLIDGEFRRLAPLYANAVVINRDRMEFHERDGLKAIVDAADLPMFHEIQYEAGRGRAVAGDMAVTARARPVRQVCGEGHGASGGDGGARRGRGRIVPQRERGDRASDCAAGRSRPIESDRHGGGGGRSSPRIHYTAADVQFIQGMIGHHGQAVEMTGLLATHTASEEMRKLGQRIALSQQDEIKMMQRWLEVRGQESPGPHAMHMLMPGMLTPEEMDRLANARGREFDGLFLEGMIKHHAGALTMVEELFSHAGAGQEPDIFAFASEVDADQRMEIDRMAAMLQELQKNESR